MKNILYIDACIKHDTDSRTERLAQAYLEKRLASGDYDLSTVILENIALQPLSGKALAERNNAVLMEDFSGKAFAPARDFAAADEIVIAAPYWDMSFPSLLKLYVEHICINKLTFCYDENGVQHGLTRIKKAVYLTTSGGYIGSCNFGFDYINAVLSTMFKIPEVAFFSAEGLDIYGNDPEKILASAIEKIYRSL